MTYAPDTIKAAQVYLKDKTDLDWVSLGIVGDANHRGGYHQGKPNVPSDDYSRDESSRDENGLTGAASALDIGKFAKGGKTLQGLSLWIVGQCKAGAPDTRDIREVIYSPDGKTVRRWDRLGIRSSGDSSHLSHTHISYHRDSEARDKTALFKRYFEGDDDMALNEKVDYTKWYGSTYGQKSGTVESTLAGIIAYGRNASDNTTKAIPLLEAVLAKLAGADTKTILKAINDRATEDAARDAAGAQRDAALLAELQGLASGGATADQIVDKLAERLGAGE